MADLKTERLGVAIGGGGDSCDNCLWFMADDAPAGKMVATGICQRHPPVVLAINGRAETHWPKVRRFHDVCGEGEELVVEDEELVVEDEELVVEDEGK